MHKRTQSKPIVYALTAAQDAHRTIKVGAAKRAVGRDEYGVDIGGTDCCKGGNAHGHLDSISEAVAPDGMP